MQLVFDYAQVIAENWTIWLVTVVLVVAAVIDGYELRGRRIRVNDADDKPPARAPGGPPRPDNRGGPSSFAPSSYNRGPIEVAPPPDEAGDFKGFRKGGGSRRGLRARKRSLRY